jgi:hypothetical protein
MPFGLPSRTAMTTRDVLTIPRLGFPFQSCVMRPASVILSTSPSSESATMSASKPPMTARDCAPLAWYDSRNSTSRPVFSFQCFWKAGMIALP